MIISFLALNSYWPSLIELQQALICLSDIDYELKSSSFDIRTMIENFIIKTCSKGEFVYAKEN